MSEMEMTVEADVEEFTDELSDEALDREMINKAGTVWCSCRQ